MSSRDILRRIGFSRKNKRSSTQMNSLGSANGLPSSDIPSSAERQTVLLLHAPNQPYQVTEGYRTPRIMHGREILVKCHAIGLNPIDWKAPDFNFGIPELPYISGRELVGEVVELPYTSSRLKVGDKVIAISTDYRDLRKAAYQEYVVAADFNVVKLPSKLSIEEGATLGVAFVAAVLALGVCIGVDFSGILGGPDLFNLVRAVNPDDLPQDIRAECLDGIRNEHRIQTGDWLAVWGGAATTANLIVQLARLFGLRVITVVDKAKHGLRLSDHSVLRPDLLVDSHDPDRAVDIIRANTKGQLRFGIDTRGRESASSLFRALGPGKSLGESLAQKTGTYSTPPESPKDSAVLSSHLVGLTGLPKQMPPSGTVFHKVPIKLFHEIPAIGETLVTWLERLLDNGLICPPEVIDIERGFDGVNRGLDRMRRREISGGKLVVRLT